VTLVYIAGPYSTGDQAQNVRNAIDAAESLLSCGIYSYIPHLSHFWHIIYEHDWETWLKLDEEILPKCDCLLRLPGKSVGADRECELAKKNNIPVFDNMHILIMKYAMKINIKNV
jgi:hypothetical protein